MKLGDLVKKKRPSAITGGVVFHDKYLADLTGIVTSCDRRITSTNVKVFWSDNYGHYWGKSCHLELISEG